MSLGLDEDVVGLGGGEGSAEGLLGTVMNLEPSLFVYFAVLRGDAGVGATGFWLLAGIIRLPNAGKSNSSRASLDAWVGDERGRKGLRQSVEGG